MHTHEHTHMVVEQEVIYFKCACTHTNSVYYYNVVKNYCDSVPLDKEFEDLFLFSPIRGNELSLLDLCSIWLNL